MQSGRNVKQLQHDLSLKFITDLLPWTTGLLIVCLFVCLFVCLSVCLFVCLAAAKLILAWSAKADALSISPGYPFTDLRQLD